MYRKVFKDAVALVCQHSSEGIVDLVVVEGRRGKTWTSRWQGDEERKAVSEGERDKSYDAGSDG